MKDKEKKINLLQNSSLFSNLKKNELEIISDYCSFINFRRGDIIYDELDKAESLYLIEKGEVALLKTREGRELESAFFISGECFGELELLENINREVTAIAKKDATLLILPDNTINFKEMFNKHHKIVAGILYRFLAIIAGRIRDTNKNITKKTPWLNDIKKKLNTDKLTGLYNNRYIVDEMDSKLGKSEGIDCLLMIKPDNFKMINDKYGHDAGDRVLRLMAIFFQSSLRENDIPIRYRGDEFAALLPGTDIKTAISIADDIKDTIYRMDISKIINEEDVSIPVSIGVSSYPFPCKSSKSLTDSAFELMFDARNNGGNRIKAVEGIIS